MDFRFPMYYFQTVPRPIFESYQFFPKIKKTFFSPMYNNNDNFEITEYVSLRIMHRKKRFFFILKNHEFVIFPSNRNNHISSNIPKMADS